MICIRVFWKKIYTKCAKKYATFDDNFIEPTVVKEQLITVNLLTIKTLQQNI